MVERRKQIACIAAFLGVLAPAAVAEACGPNETQRYQSQWTTWCIDDQVWAKGQSEFESKFFPYGDAVVQELELLFGVTPNGLPLIIEATEPNGYAQTPPACCGNGCNQNPCLGEAVTGDAYYGNAYGVKGFWGYLLTLHELVNQWTGYVTSGWPTDFWADHVSAFPNSMDWQIMGTLGAQLGDATLMTASAAQKARFYPGGDSADPRVPMFDEISALPNMGYEGWSRVFGFIQADKMSWDGLGVPNPDKLRTEYVIAYVSLGAGKSVLPIMQAANVANGTPDGFPGDAVYTGSQETIDAIATAHCSIWAASAQGVDVTADRKALKSGDFANVVAKGQCGAGCPAECGCKQSANLCVAPWLGDVVSDGGMSSSSASSASGAGGSEGGGDGSGGNGSGGAKSDDEAASSGCGCRVPGHGAGDSRNAGLLAASALAALAFMRSRGRRR